MIAQSTTPEDSFHAECESGRIDSVHDNCAPIKHIHFSQIWLAEIWLDRVRACFTGYGFSVLNRWQAYLVPIRKVAGIPGVRWKSRNTLSPRMWHHAERQTTGHSTKTLGINTWRQAYLVPPMSYTCKNFNYLLRCEPTLLGSKKFDKNEFYNIGNRLSASKIRYRYDG